MRPPSRRTFAALLALGLATGCHEATPKEQREKADALALAFANYVFSHYCVRLAAERHEPAPSAATQLRPRENLARALREVGADLPESEDGKSGLHEAVEAVRATLVANDYVFLPLAQTGETVDDDLGVSLGRVRSRDPARSLDLWGRRIEYKRIVYDIYLKDYQGWRAELMHEEGPIYAPGRYAGTTVYIDHHQVLTKSQNLRKQYSGLGLEGVTREVELRQAAYLLFMKDIPKESVADPQARTAALEQLHERVLWTAVRYGDPDAAVADVEGLASYGGPWPELQAAAIRVRAKLGQGTGTLETKEARAEALHKLAEEAWPRIGS